MMLQEVTAGMQVYISTYKVRFGGSNAYEGRGDSDWFLGDIQEAIIDE